MSQNDAGICKHATPVSGMMCSFAKVADKIEMTTASVAERQIWFGDV